MPYTIFNEIDEKKDSVSSTYYFVVKSQNLFRNTLLQEFFLKWF